MTLHFRIRRSLLIMAPVFASGILIAIQFLTLERLKSFLLEDSVLRTSRLNLGGKILSLLEVLTPVDWILLSSLLALILALIFWELRHHRLSAELEHIFAHDRTTLLLLGTMAVVITRFYLAPGQIVLGDSTSHMSRVWAAGESLAGGHWPSWSFYNYGGFPLLQFYGPLFFVFVGSLVNLFGNIAWVTKAVLFSFHFGSAFPVYGWARSTGSTRRAALICALAYILSFQHTHAVIWTGALPVALIYLLFPLLFLALERSLSSPSKGWIVLLAGTTAALILCHHGYASAGLQLAVLYLAIRWILPGPARPGWMHVFAAALGILGGVLICSGFLWPILSDGRWGYQPAELPFLAPGFPNAEFLTKILLWRNLWSGWSLTYMGITLFAFAVVGGILAWKRPLKTREDGIQRAIVLLALFALLCAARSGRNANLALLFVALLSGGVTKLRVNAIPKRLSLIVIAFLLLDLGPTTIQSPYRSDRWFLHDGLRRAAALIEPHRALVGYASGAGTHYFHWGANEDTRLILPTGYFPQGAPRSLNSINAMVDALNAPEGPLRSSASDLLYLWDVAGLILHSRDRFVDPKREGANADSSDPPIAWLQPVSPLLFSERVSIATDSTLLELQNQELLILKDMEDPMRRNYLERMVRWVDRMGLHRDQNRADHLFVAGAESNRMPFARWDTLASSPPGGADSQGAEKRAEVHRGEPSVTDPQPVEPAVTTMDYRVELDYVSIRYRAARDGYLRLAFSWDPSLRVLVDGEPAPSFRSLLGAIVIPTDNEEHTIELIPSRAQSHSLSSLLGVFLGIAAVILALRCRPSDLRFI